MGLWDWVILALLIWYAVGFCLYVVMMIGLRYMPPGMRKAELEVRGQKMRVSLAWIGLGLIPLGPVGVVLYLRDRRAKRAQPGAGSH